MSAPTDPVPHFPPAVPVRPAGFDPHGRQLAPVGRRLSAYVLDTLLSQGAGFMGPILAASWISDRMGAGPKGYLALGTVIVVAAVQYLLFVEIPVRHGWTPGKWALGLAFAAKHPEDRIRRWDLVLRWCWTVIPGVCVPFWGLADAIVLVADRDFRQSIHDRMSDTVVVRATAPATTAAP